MKTTLSIIYVYPVLRFLYFLVTLTQWEVGTEDGGILDVSSLMTMVKESTRNLYWICIYSHKYGHIVYKLSSLITITTPTRSTLHRKETVGVTR